MDYFIVMKNTTIDIYFKVFNIKSKIMKNSNFLCIFYKMMKKNKIYMFRYKIIFYEIFYL